MLALEATNDWFRASALSRRNYPAKTLMLVVEQRLHTNDLSGMLTELGWPKLVMPAIAIEPQDHAIEEVRFTTGEQRNCCNPIGTA